SRTQRELRDLTRHRTQLVEEKTRTINRIQKVLEDANIKLLGGHRYHGRLRPGYDSSIDRRGDESTQARRSGPAAIAREDSRAAKGSRRETNRSSSLPAENAVERTSSAGGAARRAGRQN